MAGRSRSLPLMLAAFVTTGCYSYRTVDVAQLSPGTEVRTRVSAQEVDRFRDHLPLEGRVLEGRFLGHAGDRILLDVPVTRDVRGMRVETVHQRLDVASSEIVELEVKELDRTRTLLMAGAGIAVVAGIVVPRFLPGGGWGRDEGGDPAPEDRFVVRIVIPLGR